MSDRFMLYYLKEYNSHRDMVLFALFGCMILFGVLCRMGEFLCLKIVILK